MPWRQRNCLNLTTKVMALLAWLWAAAGVQAQERQITWVVMDWPPIMILLNEMAPTDPARLGAGIADRKMTEVINRLPQYKHSFQLFNHQRVWDAMQDGQNICDATAFKTPGHEALAYFTPFMLVPPITLVVRADMKQRITRGAPSISLAALQRNPEFSGRIEATRSYGPALDPLLSGAGDSLKAEWAPRIGFVTNMLALGHYDYALEYPLMVEYMRQQQAPTAWRWCPYGRGRSGPQAMWRAPATPGAKPRSRTSTRPYAPPPPTGPIGKHCCHGCRRCIGKKTVTASMRFTTSAPKPCWPWTSSRSAHSRVITAQARRGPELPVGWVL
jgi:uncharacterized protein (TIGR02285 family)